MREENRVLIPQNISDISTRLQEKRKDFLKRVEKAIGETTTFSIAVSQAIGEISIEEAKQGIVDFFKDKIYERTN